MSEQLIATPGTFGENGNFLLERELGAGGMGGVYMGRDKMLDRPVAVKVMLKEYGADEEFVGKFKREAQAAAKLIHPNIAQIYSYGICDGMPYIAMELVAGGSLWSIMEHSGGKADVTRVLKIGQQVALALQCANDLGFVHGDVKPENILLDANGNAKLVDFGLAAMQKNTSEIWGTPYYISPERVKKEEVDFRADMYSLGATLYHALTGVPPFDGEDALAVVKQRFAAAPKKPSEIRSELTPAIDRLIMTMLATDKAARYPSFEALLNEFGNVLSTGLTRKIPASAAQAAAAPANGTKRLVVRSRRTMAVRRPGGAAVKTHLPGEEGDEGAVDLKKATKKPDEDEEEEGGNLGLKVAMFVLGGLLLIGAVVGGLFWFMHASAKAEQAEIQKQITDGIGKARASIADAVDKAKKYADECDAFAKTAITTCEEPTEKLRELLPPEQGGLLKPLMSKELVAALAVANGEAKPAVTAPATTAAPTNAVAKAATTNAVAKAAGTNAPAAKAAAPAPAKEEPKEELPQVVIDANKLWNRAYECQVCAARIRSTVNQIVKKGEEADALKENTRPNMEKLAELSRVIVEKFEQLKVSKDVEDIRKAIPFIRSKGKTLVDQTANRLHLEKIKADRDAKLAANAEAEAKRKAKEEAERKAKIAAEIKAADEKFETIIEQGGIRQLDWEGALRQLKNLANDLETAEGVAQAEVQIRKVSDMKTMQTVLVKNMKGYAFRGKLKGAKVASATVEDIQLTGGKVKRLSWQKLCKDYPGNLNDLINHFVVNGRKNCHLALREWSDAMMGAALIMQLACSEVPGAIKRSEQLAQEAVKQFPNSVEMARKMFPAIKFEVEEDE